MEEVPATELASYQMKAVKSLIMKKAIFNKHVSPQFVKRRMTAVSYRAAEAFFSPLVTK